MENIFNIEYINEKYLKQIGIKNVGKNVLICRNCTIIGIENISIGNNVRIDGYTSLIANHKSGLKIGSNVHIASYCMLNSRFGIDLEDFSGLSHGVKIYSASDDYSGNALTNPTIPEEYLNLYKGRVKIGKHVIIGSGSVILPNLTIGEGCSIGANSLVNKSLEPWGVFFGSPVKKIKSRSKELLKLERKFNESKN